MQQYLFCLFFIFSSSAGQRFYKDSTECPGNLKWKTTATTVMGNGPGLKPDQLTFPQGLYIEPKTQILYVADVSNNRVQKIYPDGRIELAAGQMNGSAGSTSETLNGPRDVFADENENVYIADWSNQRVQFWRKGAKTGQTVAGNGHDGSGSSEISYPIAVSVDSKSNVIVGEYQNQRITQWVQPYSPQTSTGKVLSSRIQVSGFYYDEPNNVIYIADEKTSYVTQWFLGDYEPHNVYAGIPNRPGNSAAQLNGPQGVTLDKYGNLYIVDCENNRIQLFCPDAVFGITIAGTGSIGNSSSELYYPRGIALDADLNLYVTDTYNQRIQKFERIK